MSSAIATAILIAAATIFRHPVLGAFEAYDHPLNNITAGLLTRFPQLPPLATHDFIMGIGFAALGLLIASASSALGVRLSWIAVGAVFLWLNFLWAYSVESEVALTLNRPLAESFKWSALSTYVANSAGAVFGAWLGSLGGARVRGAMTSQPGTPRTGQDLE